MVVGKNIIMQKALAAWKLKAEIRRGHIILFYTDLASYFLNKYRSLFLKKIDRPGKTGLELRSGMILRVMCIVVWSKESVFC